MRLNRIVFFSALLCLQSLVVMKEANAGERLNENFVAERGLPPDQYVNYGLELLYRGDYGGCRRVCENALYHDTNNARALNTIAIAYARENLWELSILYSEKALRANPDYVAAYGNLGKAYLEAEQWEQAVYATSKTLERFPLDDIVINDYNRAKIGLRNMQLSRVLIPIFFFVVAVIYFRFCFKKEYLSAGISTTEILLVASSIFLVLYSVFFYMAPFIRSLNIKVPYSDITTFLRPPATQHDGMETYALYILVTAGIVFCLLIVALLHRLRNKAVYFALLFLFASMSFIYFIKTGFYPAWSDPSPTLKNSLLLMLFVLAVIYILIFADSYGLRTGTVVAAIVLLPVCFVATLTISMWDYAYVLTPALKLSEGFKLPDIYFQYDLWLSLIAWLWMKLKLDVYSLQLVGAFSMYVFLLGIFLFTRKLFTNKFFPVLLLVFLIIVRVYANIFDPATVFQCTPLRLDLWLLLLILVFWQGAYHWSAGLALALLILLHKSFGIIYLAAYTQLLFVLFLIEFSTAAENESILNRLLKTIQKHFLLSLKNLLLIISAVIISIILFKGFTPESVRLYIGLGLGMLPVSKISFYWYVPVLLSVLSVLLFKHRTVLASRYFVTGVFLVLLCVGNSIYFFGRSHEHNIVNISGALSLALFMLFDIMSAGAVLEMKSSGKETRTIDELRAKRMLIYLLALVCVLSPAYYYGNRLSAKLKSQFASIKKGQITRPPFPPVPNTFGLIKELTASDSKVYFLDYRRDFVHYYYGRYIPKGYFSPCASWVMKRDFAVFLQELLDKQYYLVTSEISYVRDILPLLSFNRVVDKNGYTVISKQVTEPQLDSGKNSVLHLVIPGEIGVSGIASKPIQVSKQFTIKCLLNPSSEQATNATIVSNIREALGNRGFAIQQNGTSDDEYFFVYGDKKQWIKSAMFNLKTESWNYLVITVDGNAIRIYLNGAPVAITTVNSSLKNSDLPLVIGGRETFRDMPGISAYEPQVSTDRPFIGLIREVEISNSYMEGEAVKSEWESIEQGLLKSGL